MAEDVNVIGEHHKTLLRIEKILAGSSNTNSSGGGRGGNGRNRPGTANNQVNGSRNSTKIFKATVTDIENLGDSADVVSRKFFKLGKTVHSTRENFVALNRAMRIKSAAPDTTQPPPVPKGGWWDNLKNGFRGNPTPPPSPPPGKDPAAELKSSVSTASIAIASIAFQLRQAIVPVINDFFALQSAGINASSAMGQLYLDAGRAGMSLSQYTGVVSEASNAATRASSMEEFGKTLRVTTTQLAGFGILGAEATKMSGTLASATTALGVPQDQLGAAMTAQVSIFAKLRKTSLLTADGFQEIVKAVAANEEVQAELVGMAPAERAARQADIIQTRSLGLTMGMTKEASAKLGEALLAQRKLTTVQRFQAAGNIRQAASITGMDAGAADRLARLAQKRNRSSDENAEFLKLGGEFQSLRERLGNSGMPGSEAIYDALNERLGPIDAQLKAATDAQLAKDSGPAGQNEDFVQGSNKLLEGATLLFTWAHGLRKNPIADALIGAIGSTAFAVGFGLVLGRIFGKGGGPPPTPPPGGGPGPKPKSGFAKFFDPAEWWKVIKAAGAIVAKGVTMIFDLISKPFKLGPGTGILADIKKLWGWMGSVWDTVKVGASKFGTGVGFLKGVLGKALGAFSTIATWIGSIGKSVMLWIDASGGLLNVLGKGAGIFGKLLKGIPVIGNIISFFVDAVGEAFTGNIAAAFNADGGGWLERIGGVVFAAINGIFGGIFGLVDSAIKLFGGEGLNLENAWDKFALVMKAGLMSFLSKVVSVIPGVGGKMSQYFEESADASFAILDKLEKDKTATISSLGKEQRAVIDKEAEAKKKNTEATKESTKAIDASAGIFTSTKNLTTSLINTAQSIAARASEVEPVVAAPGQTARPTVTQSAVNTPAAPPPATSAERAAEGERLGTAPVDMTAQLATVITILQQMLVAEQAQAGFAASMASGTGKPVFSDMASMVDTVTRGLNYGRA